MNEANWKPNKNEMETTKITNMYVIIIQNWTLNHRIEPVQDVAPETQIYANGKPLKSASFCAWNI